MDKQEELKRERETESYDERKGQDRENERGKRPRKKEAKERKEQV